MEITLYAEEWTMTMGMVGLVRLLDDEDVTLNDFGLTFDSQVLEKLPQIFFEYMINEYDISERDYHRMKDNLKYIRNDSSLKSNIKQIRKLINDQLKKVKKYFPDEHETVVLQEVLDNVKAIKNLDQFNDLVEQIDKYYEVMKSQGINDKLTINYFKATVMTDFYGQVSFLNVAKNKLSKDEQIAVFYEDYIKPVILEDKFQDLLKKEISVDKVKEFLQSNNDYKLFKDIFRRIKKLKKIEEVKSVIDELPRCTFIEDQLATANFEEKTFSPLGVSVNNALNFSWDFQKDQAVPLSSLAKLVLFLAPVGVAIYNRKDGHENQGEYRSYAGFVMSDDPFPEIFRMNQAFKDKKNQDNPFDEIVHDLLQDTTERASQVTKNLFFIELYSDYRGKKTLLDYYHMPNYIAKYFKEFGDKLRSIHLREYREDFTRKALKGIEPKDVIFRYLHSVIRRNASGVGGYVAARELNRIQCLKRGVNNMHNEDKKIYVVFKQGQEIRKNLLIKGESRAAKADGNYTASGSKKINAIAYRLLNASKAGDKKDFMDTLFRIHMTSEKEVSSIFLNSLHEKDLRFETIASAFIAGLLSAENYGKKEKEEIVNE